MNRPNRTTSKTSNFVSIEESAQHLLNSNSDLMSDAQISSPMIYNNTINESDTNKRKKMYQPLLTSKQAPLKYVDDDEYSILNDEIEEDLLLNPNDNKSTVSYSSHFTSLDNIDYIEQTRSITPPKVFMTSIKNDLNDIDKDGKWTTANWTSIFLHFHSIEHDNYIYPCVMVIGIIFILTIIFMQIFLIPPSSFIFCRYINWCLLLLFCYIFAFVISYSKVSTKKWCLIRDYLYVIFWINSLICFLISIAMKCLPFLFNNSIENNLKYINCSNNDINCLKYQNEYNITQIEMDIFIVISHIIPFIYCCGMSIIFTHQYSFQNWCKEILILYITSIFWLFWNIFSYIITNKWTYRGLDNLYNDHKNNGDMLLLYSFIICGSYLLIILIVYIGCFLLHHHCKYCQHNYSGYARPKSLSQKMKEKEKELLEMPSTDDAFESGITL